MMTLPSGLERPAKVLALVAVGALLCVGLSGASAAPGDPPGGVVTINPTRILDTRTGLGVGGVPAKVGAGQTIDVVVAGVAGVPVNATGVVINVTVTNGTQPSFVTVWPSGQPRPLASSLNVTPGQDLPNSIIIAIGAAGKVSFYNNGGSTDIVADVTGYLVTGATGTPTLPPAFSRTTIATPNITASTVVQQLSLPAGSWLVLARVDAAHNGTAASTRLECSLTDPSNTVLDYEKFRLQANVGAEPIVFASVSLQGVVTLAAPGVVKTTCGSTNGSSLTLTTDQMIATQVGSITVQP